MSRISADGVTEDPWGSTAFYIDVGTYVANRIYAGSFLRIYAGSTPTGATITVNVAKHNPGGGYPITVAISQPPAQALTLYIIDPSPTVAPSVRWEVTFD